MILKHAIHRHLIRTMAIVLLSLGLASVSLASYAHPPQLPPRYTPTPLPTTPAPPPSEEPGPDAGEGEGPTKTSPPTPTMVVLMPESGDAAGGGRLWGVVGAVVVGIGVGYVGIKIRKPGENR